jgi:hypothetical protein
MSSKIDLGPVYAPENIAKAIQEAWNTMQTRYPAERIAKACEAAGEKEAAEWVRRNEYMYSCSVWHGIEASSDPTMLRNIAHRPGPSFLYEDGGNTTPSSPPAPDEPGPTSAIGESRGVGGAGGPNVPALQRRNVPPLQSGGVAGLQSEGAPSQSGAPASQSRPNSRGGGAGEPAGAGSAGRARVVVGNPPTDSPDQAEAEWSVSAEPAPAYSVGPEGAEGRLIYGPDGAPANRAVDEWPGGMQELTELGVPDPQAPARASGPDSDEAPMPPSTERGEAGPADPYNIEEGDFSW